MVDLIDRTRPVLYVMGLRCAECQCSPEECHSEVNIENKTVRCKGCTKAICCCVNFHRSLKDHGHYSITAFFHSFFSLLNTFLKHVKGLYAAALGIEILCIAAAETGENTGLYLFGFNPLGIGIAYVMGYGLAGLTTFVTILGRYNYNYNSNSNMSCNCCSVLEQDSNNGFIPNLNMTFRNFGMGIKKLMYIYKQPNLKSVLKTSIIILITVESACILTAETVALIFYNHSILFSVPLALLAGAFTVVAPVAYRKTQTCV